MMPQTRSRASPWRNHYSVLLMAAVVLLLLPLTHFQVQRTQGTKPLVLFEPESVTTPPPPSPRQINAQRHGQFDALHPQQIYHRVEAVQMAVDDYLDTILFSRVAGRIIASPWRKGVLPFLDIPQAMRQLRALLAGTSFTREVYFALLRLAQNGAITEVDRHVPSYNITLGWDEACHSEQNRPYINDIYPAANGSEYCRIDRTPSCMLPGPAGLDIETCGLPGHATKTFPRLNSSLAFYFKTYMITPRVDATIVNAIQRTRSSLIVLGTGQWGHTPSRFAPFLPKHLLQNLTNPLEQARAFLNQILRAVGRSQTSTPRLVVAYCDGAKVESRAFCVAAREVQQKFFSGESPVPVITVNVFKLAQRYWRKMRFGWPKLGHGTWEHGKVHCSTRAFESDNVKPALSETFV